jgi:hypothetical protein
MNIAIALTANADFDRGIARARISRAMALLRARKDDLLSLAQVIAVIRTTSQSYRGVRTVPVSRIVGSEGRHHDFTASFLPRREALRGRWVRVDEAYYEDRILPPVKLYEVGDVYFVEDGNHRVSVARARGTAFIDAEVTRLGSGVELRPGMTIEEIKKKAAQARSRT